MLILYKLKKERLRVQFLTFNKPSITLIPLEGKKIADKYP